MTRLVSEQKYKHCSLMKVKSMICSLFFDITYFSGVANEVDVLFEELDTDSNNELSYAELDLITEQLLLKVLPKTEL